MIVVADTSPLNYLVQIGHIDLLPALYRSVLIPPAVRDEMRHPKAPSTVQRWIANPPAWLEVREPSASLRHVPTRLDLGEREAIELALDIDAEPGTHFTEESSDAPPEPQSHRGSGGLTRNGSMT